jgi:hypothetical protein
MKLPSIGAAFHAITIQRAFSQLEAADRYNLKRDRDNDVGRGRLIIQSPNGTRYAITVSDAGALSATAV